MIILPINIYKEVKTKFLLKPIFIKSSKKQSNPKPTKTNVNNQNSTFKISSVLNKLKITNVINTPITIIKPPIVGRSEEHTSELQSRFDLVCRLLLEKKNT